MLPTIIGGLEALLKVGRGYPTKQLKVRSTALASGETAQIAVEALRGL